MKKFTFAHPVVVHAVPGRSGLGHGLLAWARSFVWARDHRVPMLSPRWFQFRLGPYLRREPDKRRYDRLFRMDGYIQGLARWAYLVAGQRVDATQPSIPSKGRRPRIVVFRNDHVNNTRFFRDIYGRHKEVREELWRITRPEHRPGPVEPFIGLHVRRGDFATVGDPQALQQGSNVRLPLQWFRDMLVEVRERLGYEMQARVFSDGDALSLRELLELPAVTLCPMRSAIHDIFLLSSAAMIIGSGSGFTMWASYLGQVPRISYPGQRRERLLTDTAGELEPECVAASDIPAELARRLRGRVNA
jgi:hypothetical protein